MTRAAVPPPWDRRTFYTAPDQAHRIHRQRVFLLPDPETMFKERRPLLPGVAVFLWAVSLEKSRLNKLPSHGDHGNCASSAIPDLKRPTPIRSENNSGRINRSGKPRRDCFHSWSRWFRQAADPQSRLLYKRKPPKRAALSVMILGVCRP